MVLERRLRTASGGAADVFGRSTLVRPRAERLPLLASPRAPDAVREGRRAPLEGKPLVVEAVFERGLDPHAKRTAASNRAPIAPAASSGPAEPSPLSISCIACVSSPLRLLSGTSCGSVERPAGPSDCESCGRRWPVASSGSGVDDGTAGAPLSTRACCCGCSGAISGAGARSTAGGFRGGWCPG